MNNDIDTDTKNAIRYYLNKKALDGEKKSLSKRSKIIVSYIDNCCNIIINDYKQQLYNIYDDLKINNLDSNDIKNNLRNVLNNDNRPSFKLTIISLSSIIVKQMGYNKEIIKANNLSNCISSYISDESEKIVDYLEKFNNKKYVYISNIKYLLAISLLSISTYYIINFFFKKKDIN
nr:anti-apoptotic membrane protein [Wadden Sea poxvirus]